MVRADDKPLVSVVVPTRNRPGFLDRAMESIGEQSYRPLEVIVVDGSDDPVSSRRVRAALGDGVESTLRRGPGRGAAAARNVGIKRARGSYLAFLDDDDRWLPSKVARQVSVLQRSESETGVVYCGQRSVDSAGRSLTVRCPGTCGDVTEALLRGAPVTPLSAVMIRADCVDEVGNLDESLPVWEDLDWFIRLSQTGRFVPIREPLILRTMGEQEQLTDQYETIRDVAYPRFVRKHRQLAATFGEDCLRDMVAARQLDVAHSALEAGRYREALGLLTGMVGWTPTSRRILPFLLAASGGPLTYRPARWLRRRIRRR